MRMSKLQLAILAVVLIVGGLYGWWRVNNADRLMRADLLMRARLIADGIKADQLNELAGTPQDVKSPYYQRLNEQLKLVKKENPDFRYIYLLGNRGDDRIVFLVGSEPPNTCLCSRPGEPYPDQSLVASSFYQWTETVKGPLTDERGRWIRTIVSITDPLTGQTIAELGIDTDVKIWHNLLRPHIYEVAAMTALLFGIVLVWITIYNRGRRNDDLNCRLKIWINPAGTAICGVLLTLLLSLQVLREEQYTQNRIFDQLAASDTELITRIVDVVRSTEMEGLFALLSQNSNMSEEDFLSYSQHLKRNPLISAWGWIPVVPAENRKAFVEQARKEIAPDFRIWQFGPNFTKVPAEEKKFYCPLLLFFSQHGVKNIIGFDMSSEPIRREAMESCARTGLPSSTQPLPLVNNPPNARGFIVYMPVFDQFKNDPSPSGYVFVSVRISSLLRRNFTKSNLIQTRLSLLQANQPPEILVPYDRPTLESCRNTEISRYLFAFDKVFVLTARPGPEFIQSYPSRKGLIALLAGLGFTVALTIIVVLVTRGRLDLEKQVASRTTQLKASDERFRQLAVHSRTLVWDINPDGLFTYVNEVFESLLGYHAVDVIDKAYFYNFFAEELRETGKKRAFGYFASGTPFYSVEDLLLSKDGRRIWVSVNGMPLFDNTGKLTGYRGDATDITEAKEAKEELLRQIAFQKMLTDIATTYINLPLSEIDSAISRSLGEFGRLFGVRHFYVMQYNQETECSSCIHEWSATPEESQIKDLQNVPITATPWRQQCRDTAKIVDIPNTEDPKADIPYRHVMAKQGIKSLLCIPMISDGKCIGFTGFASKIVSKRQRVEEINLLQVFAHMLVNIESRRNIEEELQRRGKAAEAANRTKSEFLTNMSHEIRTPMNGILGISELLSASGLNPEQKNYIEIIQSSGKLMLSLVNELLDYARIENGKVQIQNAAFHLNDLVDSVVGNLIPMAHAKNLELVIAIAPDLPQILHGDLLHLQQVLMNLVGNAVKFTEQGEILIKVSRLEESSDGIKLKFSVRDSGVGIAPEHYDRLFHPFYLGNATLSRRYGGAGLGLAISKHLIELMQGSLEFTSKVDVGTEFVFTIPLSKDPIIAAKMVEYPASWKNIRVLITDRNPTVRQTLQEELTLCSLRADTADNFTNFAAMLHQAREERDPYQIALIDCMMPLDVNATGAMADLTQTTLLAMARPGDPLPDELITGVKFSYVLYKPIRNKELERVLHLAFNTVSREERIGAVTPPGAMSAPQPAKVAAGKILLAEDNPTNQKIMLLMLQKLGLEADVADNGLIAIDLLNTRNYSLILMDVQMPELDGLEATRKIRAAEAENPCGHIPIIAVTAHAMDAHQESCKEAGMDDYLSKPVTLKSLHEVLSRWILIKPLAATPETTGRTAGQS